MKTAKNYKTALVKSSLWNTLTGLLILGIIYGCSSDDSSNDNPQPVAFGSVNGMVTDGDGVLYPNVEVTLLNSDSSVEATELTDASGNYEMMQKATGNYSIKIAPPLGSTVTNNNRPINIADGTNTAADFSFNIAAKAAKLVLEPNDPLDEIRNSEGEIPSNNELIYTPYSVRDPDAELVAVLAPDGHHITLQEWNMAEGSALVSCENNQTKFSLEFSGLIPNGVYTVWNAILKMPQDATNSLDFQADLNGLGALGESNQNVMLASNTGEASYEVTMGQGSLSMFGSRPACEITGSAGFALIVDYHIDGKTYGPNPGPDNLEVGHMTIYY